MVVMTVGAVLLVVCVLLLTTGRRTPTAFGSLAGPTSGSTGPAAAEPVSSAAEPRAAPPPTTLSVSPAPTPSMTASSMTAAARASSAAPLTSPAAPGADPPPAPAADPPSTPLPSAPVPAAPAELVIPDLAVQAPVVEVWTDDGVLHPPTDPATVGWWAASALTGAAAGNTVLAGHVDSADAGLGALAGLSQLAEGSRVEIRTDSGTAAYTVSARLVLDKGTGLPPELFDRTGPPRLVLITCGGPFDTTTLSYRDNVVVLADPA